MGFILFLIEREKKREIQFMSFIKKLALVFRKIDCREVDFHCWSILLLLILLFHFLLFFVAESAKKTNNWDERPHNNWNKISL